MATLDDSPSLYIGQPWSEWATHAPSPSADEPVVEPPKDNLNDETDSMKLRREDMRLFGLCPAQDEFFLVVCEKCNQVVKPQALKKHLKQRHGDQSIISPTKAQSLSSLSSPTKLSVSPAKTEHVVHRSGPSFPTKASVKQPPHPFNSPTQKGGAPFSSKLKDITKLRKNHTMPVVKVERMPDPFTLKKIPIPHQDSIGKPIQNGTVQNLNISPKPLTTITPVSQSAPSLSVTSATVAMATTTGTTMTTTVTSTTATPLSTSLSVSSNSSSRKKSPKVDKPDKLIPCKDREFDPNKHCGVYAKETGKQCTRSLTCKTHALSLRRAVKGRCKTFDDLLKEHREAKEALLRAKQESQAAAVATKAAAALIATGMPKSQPIHSAPGPVILPSVAKANHSQDVGLPPDTVAQSRLAQLAANISPQKVARPFSKPFNSVMHRPPQGSFFPAPRLIPKEEPGVPPDPIGRLSSDAEGDGENSQEKSDPGFLPYHPRPAAMCTFGARYHDNNGRGCMAFSRKTDFLRAAFLNLLERHLHPPPPKKLCVESNLPKEPHVVSNSKDPYEFNMVDTTASLTYGLNTVLNSSSKNIAKQKSKSPSGNQNKCRENSGSRSPGLSSPRSGNIAAKRKRSGSTGAASSPTSTVAPPVAVPAANIVSNVTAFNSQPTTNSPFTAIAIPSVNLSNATLTHFNASLNASGKQPKNNFKDLGFVLTGFQPDQAFNGQYVNITGAQLADLTQFKPVDDKTLQQSNIVGVNTKNTYAGKLPNSLELRAIHRNNVMAAVPQNTIFMDSAMQPGTLLAPVSIATAPSNTLVSLGNTAVSPPYPSPSTTPSPLFRSGSVSPQVSTSPLPNGVIQSPSDKSNTSNRVTVLNPKCHSQTSQKISHSHVASHGIFPSAVIGSSTTNPQACASQVFTTQFTQVQMKPGTLSMAKSVVSSKPAMQPVSVTIPFVSQGNLGAITGPGQTATHTLFITSEEAARHGLDLQQLSSSPSNVIS